MPEPVLNSPLTFLWQRGLGQIGEDGGTQVHAQLPENPDHLGWPCQDGSLAGVYCTTQAV